MFYVVLFIAERAFEFVRDVVCFRHVFYPSVVMLHGFEADMARNRPFRVGLRVVGKRGFRPEHFPAQLARENAVFVRPFVHPQTVGVHEGFSAYVANAIRVMHI